MMWPETGEVYECLKPMKIWQGTEYYIFEAGEKFIVESPDTVTDGASMSGVCTIRLIDGRDAIIAAGHLCGPHFIKIGQ